MQYEHSSAGSPTIAITYPFALGTRSGGSVSVFETARELARLGAQVAVLPVSTAKWTSFPRTGVGGELLGEERQQALEAEGVEVVRVAPHPLTQWWDGRRVAKALARLARRRPIDAILGFHHESSHLPDLAARLGARFGMIAIWQSYRIALGDAPARQGMARGLVERLNRRVLVEPLQRAEAVFANSEFTRSELIDIVGVDADRIRIAYQGLDPRFATLRRERPERIERLLFFGRLVEGKGVTDALEALAGLAAEGRRSWRFRMMGDGDAAEVLALARGLGIESNVEVLPFQGFEALSRELEAAHLALMPSHSESFGLSIAEAQAAGLPVVAYRCGSVPEIVDDGVSGWLAPFREVDGLRQSLAAAMADPQAAFQAGLAGRKRIADRFSWAMTAERILRGLQSLD